MKLEDIDKNFKEQGELKSSGLKTYNVINPPFRVYGVYYDEKNGFMRLPENTVPSSLGVSKLAHECAGGRIKFSTDSNVFGIHVRYKRFYDMAHMPRTGCSGFVLLDETDAKIKHVSTFRVAFDEKSSFDKYTYAPDENCKVELNSSCTLKGDRVRDYLLFMPLYAGVQSIEITLSENAKIGSGREYLPNKRVLYYGSSITQGGCASRPDNAYQGHISKWTNTDFINLGFSGNAKGEKEMAEYLASVDCNVFVCDYDHNEITASDLKEKHYNFYKAYRKVNPSTPILFVSRPNSDKCEDLKERIAIIKNTVRKAKKQGDNNVYFLSGEHFFGKTAEEREVCTMDCTHPNDLGFYYMAVAIRKALIKIDQVYK